MKGKNSYISMANAYKLFKFNLTLSSVPVHDKIFIGVLLCSGMSIYDLCLLTSSLLFLDSNICSVQKMESF